MLKSYKTYCLFVSILLTSFTVGAQHLKVINLKCESRVDPLGIDTRTPHLSWELRSDQRNVLQTGYQILVADDPLLLRKDLGNVWNSGRVSSNSSIMNAVKDKLTAATTYYWKVKVWDNKNNTSSWSQIARWQMGLLERKDWMSAKWIAYQVLPDKDRIVPAIHGNGNLALGKGKDVLPLLRKNFTVDKPIKKASIFISGLGHFEARINGEKVGDHFLDPGWTNYDKQALYVSFDITSQIKPGANAIGVLLGNGMYYIPRERYRKITGAFGYPKMICRIKLDYQDGTTANLVSDGNWKTASGPITFSSIYGGEDYDARLEQAGWDTPGFDDSNWKNALVIADGPQLTAQSASPLKVMDTLATKKISHPNDSSWVYDLGQNASGIPLIVLQGKKGDVVKITPGELLDDNGTVNQQASGAPYYFLYTLKGGGRETWRPLFTYYGFRYLQVEGAIPARELNAAKKSVVLKIEGLHTRNSADKTGDFSCSDQLFNRTYNLINWAIKSNMASILTDCPHREKLGWLEEAHLMGNSIRYNYDVANLFMQEISNIRQAQRANGMIPDIAPEYVVFEGGFVDSPEWGSTGVILPWYVYQWYGNKQVLTDNYEMIRRYVDYLKTRTNNNLIDYGLGDWFDIGPKAPGEAQLTPKALTATAYYYYNLRILSKIARLTGKAEDALKYEQIAKDVKRDFNHAFYNAQTHQYATGSQTANAISVYMALVDPENKQAVVDNIVNDLRAHKNAITAGDIGFRYLLKVLADEGRSDVIFDMNSRSDVPGYGYQLAHGATALTESWQAYRFVSNNHFMLGHLMEWFYNNLAGISQQDSSVASRQIVIRPEPVGNITSAKATFHSPYGNISSSWVKAASSFKLHVEIPPNTSATIYLPTNPGSLVYAGGKMIAKIARQKYFVVHTGSGIFNYLVK
ncbi:MAG: alpha-L-rhamnosidase [Mucilaginibacter sp.]|nr:alpha-L-rhamnosidase [Mucilaginibacter sp.]